MSKPLFIRFLMLLVGALIGVMLSNAFILNKPHVMNLEGFLISLFIAAFMTYRRRKEL